MTKPKLLLYVIRNNKNVNNTSLISFKNQKVVTNMWFNVDLRLGLIDILSLTGYSRNQSLSVTTQYPFLTNMN